MKLRMTTGGCVPLEHYAQGLFLMDGALYVSMGAHKVDGWAKAIRCDDGKNMIIDGGRTVLPVELDA